MTSYRPYIASTDVEPRTTHHKPVDDDLGRPGRVEAGSSDVVCVRGYGFIFTGVLPGPQEIFRCNLFR